MYWLLDGDKQKKKIASLKNETNQELKREVYSRIV